MSESKQNNFLNITAAIFLTGFSFFVLKELQSILIPLFIAIIISFVFLPMYTFLVNKKIPAGVAVAIVILSIFFISNIAILFIVKSVGAFSEQFPVYEKKFLMIYESIISRLNLSEIEAAGLTKSLDLRTLLMEGKFTSAITGLFSGITALLGNYILIIFYVIFLLSESKSIQQRILVAFPGKNEESMRKTFSDIFGGVRNYISGKTLLSFLQAVLIGTILWICGVEFFFIWAFMFFLSDFIPNIGSLIVSVLIGIFMMLQFESIIGPAVILAVLILIQNLKGNILEPKIFGSRLDLSPLLLLLSLIFWGYIWGLTGLILSVPIMSMIKIILMNFPATKPIAILMSYNINTINKL